MKLVHGFAVVVVHVILLTVTSASGFPALHSDSNTVRKLSAQLTALLDFNRGIHPSTQSASVQTEPVADVSAPFVDVAAVPDAQFLTNERSNCDPINIPSPVPNVTCGYVISSIECIRIESGLIVWLLLQRDGYERDLSS